MKKDTYYSMSMMTMAAITGLTAGIAGTLVGFFMHYIHFTQIGPKVILGPLQGGWKQSWRGTLVVFCLYMILSLIAALIYYWTLKKKSSYVWGLGYGLVLFAVVFYILFPLLPDTKPLLAYDLNTILTSLGMYILLGTFIGYSISYEYEEFLYLQETKVKQ